MAAVKAKVMFAYDAEQEDEISLHVGDIITNIDMQDGGWWEGEVKGKRGVFPENFVEVIKEEAPTVKKSSSLPKATVTFDYVAAESDELDLKAGDVIEVIKQDEEGWWEGKFNGKIGMFPSNFVELISNDKINSNLPEKPALIESRKEEPASDSLIDLKEKENVDKNSKNLPPGPGHSGTDTEDAETNQTDGNKPKQPMGFGFMLSNADLLKTRLRPVSGIEEPKPSAPKDDTGNKPMQRVSPLGKAEDGPPPLKKTDSFTDGGNIKRNAPAPPKVPVVPEPIPARSGERYVVKFSYEPENEDEIELKIGEIILVTNKDVCEGWWEGKLNGKTGVFPNNFVEPAPELIEDPVKDKVPAKKVPLLPHGKTPSLPAKEKSEGSSESSHVESKPTLPDTKKPMIPESRKPVIETTKAPLPEPKVPVHKKTEFKKPPPPVFKSKPVPPKPNIVDKQPTEESQTGPAKSDTNPPRTERPRMPSVGRKPPLKPTPEPHVSIAKEPVPARPEKPKNDATKNAPKEKKEEVSRLDLDSVSSGDVLSNMNKNRVKGPQGKTLPAKYTQKKDEDTEKQEQSEEINQPPWKNEISRKLSSKRLQQTSSEEKTVEREQPKALQLDKPSMNKDIADDLKSEISSIRDKMAEMEKRFMIHIKVLTDDLDSEKKQRASMQIEIDRLKKKVSILEGL